MKAKPDTKDKLVKVPEGALRCLIADKLQNRVLFAEKIEELKKDLQAAKINISLS